MRKIVLLFAVAILGMAISTANAQNKAIQFQDSSFVYLDDNITDLGDECTNLTLEAWIKPDTTGGFASWAGIIYNRNDAGASTGLQTGNYREDTVELIPLWADIYWIETGVYLDINEWQHVAMTVSPDAVKAYVNGEFVYEYTSDDEDIVAQNFQGTERWVIGHDRFDEGWFGRTWRGGIDEVRIWNTTRTDEEIMAAYNGELEGNETDLVGYYNFNSVIGTIVPNSGVGPTATIINGDDATVIDGPSFGVGIKDKNQQLENVKVFAKKKMIEVWNENDFAEVNIYNPLGQVVISKTIKGNASFNINDNNIYIVKVTAEGKSYTHKVLICD